MSLHAGKLSNNKNPVRKLKLFIFLNVRDDCLRGNTTDKPKCYQQLIEFYSYKLVKSIFNYGKISIYAGLWVKRFVISI